MNRGGLFLSLLLVGLPLFACSSSRDSSGVGGACSNYASALRDAAKQCGRFNVSPSRESEYLARFEQSCQNALNAPGSGISPSILDQCANKIREECGDDDACEDLLEGVRGTLAEGTACDVDYQCASGQCKTGNSSTMPSQTPSTCGKCAPAAKIGEPCPEGGCETGASCRVTSTGSTSTSICVAERIVGEGETCGSNSTTSDEAVRCATGLYCSYDSTGGSGKCRTAVGEGQPCGAQANGYARCKAPLACVNERCGTLLPAGSACKESNDCQSGLGCDPATNQCAAIAWGATGAVCDDNLRRCDRGFCQRTGQSTDGTGNCAEYIPDGAACDQSKSDQRCDSFSRCFNGICQIQNPASCQ